MMSPKFKSRDETTSPTSSDELGKPNQSPILSQIYTSARKSLLSKNALCIIILILVLYSVLDLIHNPTSTNNIFNQTQNLPSNDNDTDLTSSEDDLQEHYHQTPVKLYMYDLPYRFTYGIIEYHYMSHSNKRVEDVTKLAYPAHQHMAEWFIFDDLQQQDSERVGSPVVRVYDPEEAELFYVPFFSSLSMIVTRMRPEGSDKPWYNNEETQEALIEWLEGQEYWKRNNGRDHVIVSSDPNSYHHVIDKVKNCVMLLAGFGRLRMDQGSLVKDVVAPYTHRIAPYQGEVGVNNRNTLLFFMGARFRKEGGKIRDILFDILEKEENVLMKQGKQTKEDRRTFTDGMHTSKFCLNPAGDTATSCRLFDSIVSLCVPVIVSDEIELPFEDIIDYTKIAIFVDTERALKPGFLVSLLRAIPDDKIVEYQQQLREVKPYFEFRRQTLDQIWREVTHKLPLMKMMINRQRRLVMRRLSEHDCSCLCSNQTIDTENVLI